MTISKSLNPSSYTTAVDNGFFHTEDAFNTTCNICGEWLDFGPEITRGSDGEITDVVFVAGSCGERFVLKATGYIMTIESEGLV
jgi:hypothetical protein